MTLTMPAETHIQGHDCDYYYYAVAVELPRPPWRGLTPPPSTFKSRVVLVRQEVDMTLFRIVL